MSPADQLQALLDTSPTPVEALTDFYDGLPAVAEADMLGAWTGGVFATGHPGESQLDMLGWVGKTFRSRDDVDPIVRLDEAGERVANPVLGTASLREVTHRGVTTATMVYDKQPIFDHFRRVDGETVLGWMDRKGEDVALFFYLRRV